MAPERSGRVPGPGRLPRPPPSSLADRRRCGFGPGGGVADRVAVMYLGRIVEVGPVEEVMERPIHPYTKALLAALPQPDPRRRRARYRIGGEVPTLVHPPPGCRFAPRCPFVIDRCIAEDPPLRMIPDRPGRTAACHRAEEVGDVPPEQLLVSPETQADSGSSGAG